MLRLAFDIGGTFTDYVLQDIETGRIRIWKVPTTREPAHRRAGDDRGKDFRRRAVVRPGLRASFTPRRPRPTPFSSAKVRAYRLGHHGGISRCHPDRAPEAVRHERPLSREAGAAGRPRRTFSPSRSAPPPTAASSSPFDEDGARAVAREIAAERLRVRRRDVPPLLRQSRCTSAAWRRSCASAASTSRCRATSRRNSVNTSASARRWPTPMCGHWSGSYLDSLNVSLREKGFRSELAIMQSNGGLVSSELAREHPVRDRRIGAGRRRLDVRRCRPPSSATIM